MKRSLLAAVLAATFLVVESAGRPAAARAFTVAGLGIEMLPIPAGSFLMGTPPEEPGRDADEGPRVRVTLSQPFWLSRTDVTQGQWKEVMGTDLVDQVRTALADDTLYSLGGRNLTLREQWGLERNSDPSRRLQRNDPRLPMQYVTWEEARDFCRKLNERARKSGALPAGYEYRLPTEAQWEYACRAGTTAATYAGPLRIRSELDAPVLDAIAWYGKTAIWTPDEKAQYPGGSDGPHDVALKRPNPWGLYDMVGNVYQWCLDWYGPYQGGSALDPTGPATGATRVMRGGCWNSTAAHCRSGRRAEHPPGVRSNAVGIRLALSPL